jgi:hypothetical protein
LPGPSSPSIKIAAVARQLGVLIAELLEANRERINVVFDHTLDLIGDAFQARKIFVVRGVILDGGPGNGSRGGG